MGTYYTIVIIRKPQNPILIIEARALRGVRKQECPIPRGHLQGLAQALKGWYIGVACFGVPDHKELGLDKGPPAGDSFLPTLVAEFISPKKFTLSVFLWVLSSRKV